MSLATKYRPQTFDSVVGQDITIKILTKQLETRTFGNCYLFTGPSGDGKTTIARIFANEINKGKGQPIEIDGASNNGVDNVRNIIADANNRSLISEYKIFIIDECHQITIAGWNAFLKCIEEPPKYTIFLFCTTDPQKIPDTITNRCLRFDLNRLSKQEIKGRLEYIAEQEKAVVEDSQALDYIASISDGCMREAISNLEKVLNITNTLSVSSIFPILGTADYNIYFDIINAIIDKQNTTLLNNIKQLSSINATVKVIVDNLLLFTLDLTKYTIFKDTSVLKYIPEIFEENIKYTTGVKPTQQECTQYFNNMLSKLYLYRDIKDINTLEIILLGILNETM